MWCCILYVAQQKICKEGPVGSTGSANMLLPSFSRGSHGHSCSLLGFPAILRLLAAASWRWVHGWKEPVSSVVGLCHSTSSWQLRWSFLALSSSPPHDPSSLHFHHFQLKENHPSISDTWAITLPTRPAYRWACGCLSRLRLIQPVCLTFSYKQILTMSLGLLHHGAAAVCP